MLGAAGAAAHFYLESTKPPTFSGREIEPNHDPETATAVPFATPVRGRLGQRIAPGRGDQDNYWINVPQLGPGPSQLRLALDGLPNMPVCAWLFKKGAESPTARYCSGQPGRGLVIEELALRPGPYLFVILQDMDKYEADQTPLLHENVSDDYELLVSAKAAGAERFEVEPNESEERAQKADGPQPLLSLDGTKELRGRLNFMRDVDVVCATGNTLARFVVSDAEGGVRPIKTALLVTPIAGPQHKIPVRVHGERKGFEQTARDQPGPFTGPATDLSLSPCIRLELTPNPLAPLPHPIVAPASDHEWRVTLQPVQPHAASGPSAR